MIHKTFLGDIANYTNGRITKVLLNDSVVITNFTVKEVTDSTVGMQFVVPAASTSLITKIDVKDSQNRLISSNNVYVPIVSDTLLLHTINIKEGK